MNKTVKLNFLILVIILISLNIISYLIIQFFDTKNLKESFKHPAAINKNYSKIQKEFIQLETEYQPYVGWSRKATKGKYTNINNQGNRITVQYNLNTQKVIRFFGGSTMWGSGVEDAQTIPSWFVKCKDDFSVINHGESGFNSRQNLASFINVLIKEESVNTVIFYDGVNDIEHLCKKEINIPGHGREVQMRNELETVNSTQSYISGRDGIIGLSKRMLFKLFFKNTAEFIYKLKGKFSKRELATPYCCDTNEEKAKAVVNHLLNNWKIARQLSEANGIEFIAILQPNIYSKNMKQARNKENKSDHLENNFLEIYRILKEEIKAYGWIYDFMDIFDNINEPLYFDFCHVNEKGNKIIGNKICKILEETNRSKE